MASISIKISRFFSYCPISQNLAETMDSFRPVSQKLSMVSKNFLSFTETVLLPGFMPKRPFFTSHFQWNFDSFKQFQFFFFWNWSETANSLNQRIQNRITASKTYLFNKNWVSKNCYFSDFWWKKMRCQKKKDSKMSAIFFKNAIHFCVLKLLNTNFRHASKSR